LGRHREAGTGFQSDGSTGHNGNASTGSASGIYEAAISDCDVSFIRREGEFFCENCLGDADPAIAKADIDLSVEASIP
jgi:hypothetical protein